jgi:hypothetical protein
MRQSYPLPPPMVKASVSGSLPVAVSPGWQIGPSQRYLRESFPRCLDPYPGGPCGAHTRFFPQGVDLPQFLTGSALHNVPYNDVSTGVVLEAAAIHSCSGLRVCSPPRSFPPQRSLHRSSLASQRQGSVGDPALSLLALSPTPMATTQCLPPTTGRP